MAAPYMKVTYMDGREVVVRIGPKTQVLFERHFPAMSMLDYGRGRGRRIEHHYFLAWAALTEAKEETREFDAFLEVLEDAETVRDTPDTPVGDKAVNPEPDPSLKAQPPAT